MNQLFYGDNLNVLREHIAAESVDLIYLDPPFNSKRDYNLLFKSPKGHESEAQITAFEDSWHWGEQAEREFDELLHQKNTDVAQMMQALRAFLGENDMMAYLTMMANRLLELHRVLKPTGSLYLHCDPTASHYLKIVLDGVFGKLNYRNEIIWKRTSAHANVGKKFGVIHDTIFLYGKTDEPLWNQQYAKYDEDYIETFFDQVDEHGKKYARRDLTAAMQRASKGQIYSWKGITPPASRCWAMTKDRMDALDSAGKIHWPKKEGGMPRLKLYPEDLPGVPTQDIWTDIRVMHNLSSERLGYDTQKPLALLERIINASSNEGDVVLDPFCGCGTAVHAAQKLKRKWIGIDITHLAVSLIEKRLRDAFYDKTQPPEKQKLQFDVIGTPKDLDAARDLARRDKYQFQWWAVSLVEAQPWQGKKKGADSGIDGLKFFGDLEGPARKIIVNVKGGESVGPAMVKDLIATVARDKADIGLFITLAPPTPAMVTEAAAAGFYESSNGRKFPRIQILTIEDLLSGEARAEHPDYVADVNFKKAKKEAPADQKTLDL